MECTCSSSGPDICRWCDGCPQCCSCAVPKYGYSYRPPEWVFTHAGEGCLQCGVRVLCPIGFDLPMGVELELDEGCSSRLSYRQWPGVLKHDCSLSNTGQDGFEYVTHPGTLAAHKKMYRWAEFLAWAREARFRATRRTGLHIHCSKQWLMAHGFSPEYAVRTLAVAESFFGMISRRDGEMGYCVFNHRLECWACEEHIISCRCSDAKRWEQRAAYHDDRYVALNLAWSSQRTIEVRLFRATTDLDELLGAIEIVRAWIGDLCCRQPEVNSEKEFVVELLRSLDQLGAEYAPRLGLVKYWREHVHYSIGSGG